MFYFLLLLCSLINQDGRYVLKLEVTRVTFDFAILLNDDRH